MALDASGEPVEIGLGTMTVRGLAVWALAAVAALFFLREAAPVVVPVLVSILLAYALEPAVDVLTRWHLPRPAAVAVVYVLLATAIGVGVRELRNEVNGFLADLPETVATLQQAFEVDDTRSSTPIGRIREAVRTIEQATASAAPPPRPGVARVSIVREGSDIRAYLAAITNGVLQTTIQLFTIGLLTFLLLASGDLYKRKLVTLAGPTLVDRKITIETIRSIDRQIERYLLVRVLICGIVAAATGISIYWLGVQHAAVWGLIAGALNILPFIGPTIGVVLIAVAAFLQFKALTFAGAAAAAAAAVAAFEGNLLTPLLMSRAGELNTVAVFVSVLVWGWLWDVWGLLLAVPIMVAVKAAADHVESLKPIGELLGR
jgi:predicted PurR-regulated permease PerM